jgi:phosphoribosylaminoimidazolecarboxamide formyltransferase/IMP cyclohydrolase
LATEAFGEIASYDAAISNWFGGNHLSIHGKLLGQLRYGENPHQPAALYRDDFHEAGVATAELLNGKPMSYNNYVDAEAARAAAFDHVQPCVAIVKHANPCGIAIAKDCLTAYRNAFACDPVSAFGGVVALNRPLDAETARAMVETFLEVVIAPAVSEDALAVLKEKPSLRVLKCVAPHPGQRGEIRFLSGGFLWQRADDVTTTGGDSSQWAQVSGGEVSAPLMADLEFAWSCSRAPHSNAIVLVKDLATVGIGMGQVNRVDAVTLAVSRAADERCKGAVAASDAFFPFPDGLAKLITAGISAVVQPGGSIRDDEVIALARQHDLAMFFTNVRHFSH